jgi:ribose 5-phosphate isomerase A
MSQIHLGKKAAGEKAAEYIRAGMTVGLGTGSTAYWAIEKIGSMVADGLDIKAVATSLQSEKQAKELGIPLVSFAAVDQIDVDIDGADEVDERLCLIKGGGGALLREKIIASASKQMIVVADHTKLVSQLGCFPLAVEVIPFGWELTIRKLKALGCEPTVRTQEGKPFITDNGNLIMDCAFGTISDPASLHDSLNNTPGVVENGLFVGIASRAVIGYPDGHTQIIGPEGLEKN